ncbi:ABC transporter ATP-binding protein [bacterium D16-76]|nr:ABC transporter ATP-binding protein [bacterium D16-76]
MKRGKIAPHMQRIFSYLKPFKREFLLVGLTMLISVTVGFLQPLVIQSITDNGMLQQNMRVIVRSVLALAGLVIVNQAIDLWQTRIFADVHNKSYYLVFHQVFEKLLHLKKSYFEDKNNTEILSFLQMDVSQVSSITDRYMVMSASYIFRIISGLVGLFVISWKLALVVLAMVPVKFFLVKGMSKRREKAMDEMIESSRDFSRWFGDNLNGVDEIKLWNLFQSREKIFAEKQRELLKLEKKGTMIDGWNSFWEVLLEWSVTIVLYLLGGWLICTGSLTIGAVFAFSSYSGYVTGPVSALINLKMYFARIMPSARRLFQFLDMETEPDAGKKTTDNEPLKLEFRDVAFCYEENRPILQGVNFTVEPGEKVAIIGQNGSGKSTILNILLRFYQPDAGQVLADGIDVNCLSLEDYRSLFSVVSQEPYLFLGNILENTDLTGEATEEQLCAALKDSGVASYITRMPDGEKTQIGRNGAKLSGGEKQKLAVARALLKDASVVILDEATSGFDVESDAYLHDIIVNQMQEKSVIMITHHYNNLEGMDRVYRLEDGVLSEVHEMGEGVNFDEEEK